MVVSLVNSQQEHRTSRGASSSTDSWMLKYLQTPQTQGLCQSTESSSLKICRGGKPGHWFCKSQISLVFDFKSWVETDKSQFKCESYCRMFQVFQQQSNISRPCMLWGTEFIYQNTSGILAELTSILIHSHFKIPNDFSTTKPSSLCLKLC